MANVSGKDIEKKIESKHVTTLKDWFEQDNFKKKILAALPRVINGDAFIINAYNIYANDTKLQKCSISSFLNALMQAAKVGLMPNTPLGHCYIIPYYNSNKNTYEANFQMGYPGHIELALRTKQYKTIYAHEVYPLDKFRRILGMHKDLIHLPSEDPNRKKALPTHFYAVYKLINGGENFECWTRDEVLQHRDKFSTGYKKAKDKSDTVWVTDEEAMALKTMIVRVLHHAPKSTEMVYALSTEPGEEGRKNMFPEETDITPQPDYFPTEEIENHLAEKPEIVKSEEIKVRGEVRKAISPEEEIAQRMVASEGPITAPNKLNTLVVIAKEAGYSNWKAIIIEGCRVKSTDGRPVFDASVTEKEAKEILINDEDRYGVIYHHFNIMVDQQNAGRG